MITALPRQSMISVAAFLGILLATIAWGVNSMLVNNELQGQFELKSQLMDRLRAQSGVASRNGGSAVFSCRIW